MNSSLCTLEVWSLELTITILETDKFSHEGGAVEMNFKLQISQVLIHAKPRASAYSRELYQVMQMGCPEISGRDPSSFSRETRERGKRSWWFGSLLRTINNFIGSQRFGRNNQ